MIMRNPLHDGIVHGLVMLAVLGLLAFGLFRCCGCAAWRTPETAHVVDVALTDADKACIWSNAEHADLPKGLQVIRQACAILEVADPVIQKVVDDWAAHRSFLGMYVVLEDDKTFRASHPAATTKPERR